VFNALGDLGLIRGDDVVGHGGFVVGCAED
jgi:hypothetical protein